MKRILCIMTLLAVFAGSVRADEGMWMLPLLQKMNGKAMKELGCQLSPKEIYDMAMEMQLHMLEIPEEYGGLGLDKLTCAALYEEMARADAGFALTFAVSSLFFLKPIA